MVVAFPVFEHHLDHIGEWLSALSNGNPGTGKGKRVARSVRSALAKAECVRNSPRHGNLASFLRHAANALEAGEWDSAGYILLTARALMSAPANRGRPGLENVPTQFPVVETTATVKLPSGVVKGIATG